MKESCISPRLELFRLLRLRAVVAGTLLQMVIIESYDCILTMNYYLNIKYLLTCDEQI